VHGIRSCLPRSRIPSESEPISQWRKWSKDGFKILHSTANLLGAPALSTVTVSVREKEAEKRKLEWNLIINGAQRWLVHSAVSWTLFVPESPKNRGEAVMVKPRQLQLVANCPMLFDVLAFQLAQAITRSEGLYVCAGCNQPFFRNWRATKGHRVFCRDCGKRAAMRLYMREKRKGKVLAEGE
jgi:DNA-directed RNA polymerase subunit RPC12/RpoP